MGTESSEKLYPIAYRRSFLKGELVIFSKASDPSSATTSQGPVPSAVSGAANPTGGSAAAQPALQTSASISKSPSRNEQQLNYLLERQKEFKMAAVQSKKQGDLEGAKNYLRMGKVGK